MRHHDKRLNKKLQQAAEETIKTEKQRQRLLRKQRRSERRERYEGGERYGWQAEPRNQEGPAAQGEPARQAEEGQVDGADPGTEGCA